jgi:hypothetical protein
MSRQADYKNAANKVLDDAKSRYEAANSLYTSSVETLTSTQDTISSANCYVNQHSVFTVQLNSFCQDSNQTNRQLSILAENYGILIINKPSEQLHSTREDYDIDYYVTENQCTTNTSGEKTCKDVRVQKSRRVYYTIYTTVYLNYGMVLAGSGSKLNMGCGKFEHGITISSSVWQKSTTGMQRINKYNEQEVRTFASTAKADIKFDNQLRSSSQEIATSDSEQPQIASRILAAINQQCKALTSSLKSPSFYTRVANDAFAKIPTLQEEIERTKKIRDQEAAIRDAKQSLYDSADNDYRHELSIWLPVILIPIPTFIFLIMCFEEQLKNKFFDTNDCCAPSVREAIPVATLLFRLRNNNSRTNIDQEPTTPTATVVELPDVEAAALPSAPDEFALMDAGYEIKENQEQVKSQYNAELDEVEYFDANGMKKISNRKM